MNEALKKRLIGAIVLGCLAIIFIPLLLDGEGLNAPELNLDMPPAPGLPAIPEIQAARVDLPEIQTDNSLEVPDQMSESTNTEETSPIVPLQLNNNLLPEAWTVRLAAFSDQKNAESLETQLLESNYKAYSRPINSSSQGMLTAVYVGPMLTESEAINMIEELSIELGLTGVVLKFTIDE